MNYIDITIEDMDQKIENLRARLQSAIHQSKVPIAQNPKVLALSRTLDTLIVQVQRESMKE